MSTFLSWLSLWAQLQTIVTFSYSETTTGKTSIHGYFETQFTGYMVNILNFLRKQVVASMNNIVNEIMEAGENALTFLNNDYEEAKKLLSKEQIAILESYLSRDKIQPITQPQLSEPRPLWVLDITKNNGKYVINYENLNKKQILPLKIKPVMDFGEKNRKIVIRTLDRLTNTTNSIISATRGSILSERYGKGKQVLNDLKDLGSYLFDLMIPKPLAEEMKTRDQYILLETNDVEMPWELMHDGTNFLCLKNHIGRTYVSEVPVESGWKSYQDEPTPKPRTNEKRKIAIIIDPNENLPATKVEKEMANKLDSLGDISVFEGSEFNTFRAQQVFGHEPFDIIHYAGHAKFEASAPQKSALMLSDGEITASELARIVSKNNYKPSIMFMNACTSAREGKLADEYEYLGYESAGFASMMLNNGIRSYLGTLWNVFDTSASTFSNEFYKRVLENQTIGSALTDARRLAYTESQGADLTWASFILYGNPTIKI